MVKVFSTNCKLTKRIIPEVYRRAENDYDKSNENMIRSIAVYYSGGIMGKKKYRSTYRDISYQRNTNNTKSVRIKVNNCPVPRLLPYNRLMNCIKSIDIGKLYSIR